MNLPEKRIIEISQSANAAIRIEMEENRKKTKEKKLQLEEAQEKLCGEGGITCSDPVLGWLQIKPCPPFAALTLAFLLLRFCGSSLPHAPQQKCPRLLAGDMD
jgi:hypothetical protein